MTSMITLWCRAHLFLWLIAGGLGFADVAVTCLPQATSDSQQGSIQGLSPQQPPLSPNLTWQELQGHSGSRDNSPEQKKNGLLGSAFGAAANILKAIGNPAKGDRYYSKLFSVACILSTQSPCYAPAGGQLMWYESALPASKGTSLMFSMGCMF